MLKQLLLLFNLFSFFVVTFLLPDGIKVNYETLPNEFVRDSTYIIEVTIEKGDIFGFAKFQQNVPTGFVAQPVETADASFTFADGKVKFIWMALPEMNEVKISYALTASQDTPDEGLIEGKFSYIQDNERKSYDTPNIPIKIISDEPVVATVPASANVERSVTALGNNEYEVRLYITKEGISGFSKVEEYLPDGAEAVDLESAKSMFSQVDEKAKFVWMAIPESGNVSVAYKVSAAEDIENDLKAMEGNFSYLDENETKTVAIVSMGEETPPVAVAEEPEEVGAQEEPTQEEEVASNETPDVGSGSEEETAMTETTEEIGTPPDEQPQEVASNDTETTPAEEEEVVAQKERTGAVKTDEQDTPPVTAPVVPNPETGVSYKVQIVAGHKVVAETFLRKKYTFQEPYLVENHQGWVKYTTGSFEVYRGARDKREQLVAANHNFPGPFVTAYNEGERITVQEALMISNQKWFK